MKTPDNPENCLDELKGALQNKRVFFYGGGAIGTAFLAMFEHLNLYVEGIFDRDCSKQTNSGVKVFSPDKIKDLVGTEDVLIGTVNWRNQEVIKKYLDDIGVINELIDGSLMHSPLQRSICTLYNLHNKKLQYEKCSCCFIESSRCDIMRENIMRTKPGVKPNEGKSRLPLCEVIVGNVCTLRCKHCLEGVPYSKFPRKQDTAENLIKAIKRVAEASEFLTSINFLGGEPTLHPDLYKIIEFVLSIPNVGIVKVVTNATVKPSPKLLEVLKNKFVVVNVSDYSAQLPDAQKAKIEETIHILKESNVAFSHIKNMTWYDMSSFKRNNDDETALKKRFKYCRMNGSHRMYDSKIFPCSHFYAGYVTGQLELDDTIINIFEGDIDSLSKRLNQLWNQPYSTACKYCEMPYVSKLVPGGEQV